METVPARPPLQLRAFFFAHTNQVPAGRGSAERLVRGLADASPAELGDRVERPYR